jgi:hypothetical protein
MKIRNFAVLTLLAVSLPMAVTMVNANPTIVGSVELYAWSGVYPGLGGGEFTAHTTQNYIKNYASVATYAGGFATFCIETGVDFTPKNWGGPTYSYSLGNVAQPLTPANGGRGASLSAGTAWLYSQFAIGKLAGFHWTYGSDRQSDDNLLQAAIWTLQGGQTYSTYGSLSPATVVNNIFYKAAVDALGSVDNADAAYTGTSVKILQMWVNSDGTVAAQNQLVYVPDGGMTAALLGGTLFGLQMLRRKLA